jgi:hypothetical protein
LAVLSPETFRAGVDEACRRVSIRYSSVPRWAS